jgi:hypothetical protein
LRQRKYVASVTPSSRQTAATVPPLPSSTSACARKIVYELARLRGAKGDNYDEQIKSLKLLIPDVADDYFDTLLTIQQLTSQKVHEDSFDGWDSKHVRVILASLKEALNEIYVVPAVKKDRRSAVLRMKEELTPKKQAN